MSHEPEAHSASVEYARVFADGCDECEYRVGRGLDGLSFLDPANRVLIGQMAAGTVTPETRLDDRMATEVRIAARAVIAVGLRLEDIE